jgi:CheY-like chemotaxis protein
MVCEGEGYYVASAAGGQQAMNLLKEFRPMVIVTDLMMPNVTGLDLIRHVRSDPDLNKTPIIVVSAAQGEILDKAKALGATEVLRKPLDIYELIKVVDKYAPEHAPMLAN